jgi:signal transduction histidine kinase
MELRHDSPLPSYREELIPSQYAAIRMACLLSAGLLVTFSLLDRLVASDWLSLLVVRLAGSVLLLVCAQAAGRARGSPLLLCMTAVALIAGTVEAALLKSGGAASPYLYSIMIVQAGISILIPLGYLQVLVLNLETLAIALLPLLPPPPSQRMTFLLATSYLACMAVVSIAGAAVQDRLRRREHQARAEFARHFGLLNLGTLAGGLAHELSNPLNALGMQVEMLGKDPDGAPKRIEKLRGSLDRMRNILEAMRNGARLSGGERRPIDLAHEVDLAFTLMEGRLRTRAALVRAYAEVPPVFCQPTLLGQVLVNLLANAADAVAGRPRPRIALRVRREGALALVEVEDNGPGVPEELRERIFEPFFTTKGDSGNGLGLWISSQIASVQGGSLSVHQGSAGGALFRLALPIDARTGEEPERQEAAQA